MADLTPTVVKINVKLGEISLEFDSELHHVFSNFIPVELIIPFFKSGSIRQLTEDDTFEAIPTTTAYIVTWLESHFGGFFSTPYLQQIASHTVCYLVWIYPDLEISSEEFRTSATIFVMGILVDDIGDRVVLPILPNGVDFVPREFYKLQNKLLQLNSKFGYDPEIAKHLGSLADPLSSAIINAFSNLMEKVMEPGPNYWKLERQRAYFRICMVFNTCEKWIAENGDPFQKGMKVSFEMYRKFRDDVSGCTSFAETHYITKYEAVPSYLIKCPVLLHWEGVANRIFACFNDILGFRKDVRKGCTDGVVMLKIIHDRLSPKDALEEEAAVLKTAVNDYLSLRSQLWVEYEEIREYLKIMDNILFGQLFAFLNSERFGMKECLEVE